MLLCTLVFGVLAGYALAVLQWRGRGVTFALALLVQVVPFQLLIIPLYVLIARNYGLGDNYLGMILPFAINSTAVIIFRQYFLQLPRSCSRRPGSTAPASCALCGDRPAAGPPRAAHGRAADLHRAVERVPLAVPDHQGAVDAAAGRVAGELHHERRRHRGQPVRRDPGRRRRARRPAVVLFIVFQRYFISTDIGSGVKG